MATPSTSMLSFISIGMQNNAGIAEPLARICRSCMYTQVLSLQLVVLYHACQQSVH